MAVLYYSTVHDPYQLSSYVSTFIAVVENVIEQATHNPVIKVITKMGTFGEAVETEFELIANEDGSEGQLVNTALDIVIPLVLTEAASEVGKLAVAGIYAALNIGTIPELVPIGVTVTIGVTVSVLYDAFLEGPVDILSDIVQGTVDTDIRLYSADGLNLLRGALDLDGIDPADQHQVVRNLIEQVVEINHLSNDGDQSNLDGATIKVFEGTGVHQTGSEETATITEWFSVYNGSMIDNAANVFFNGDISDFKNYGGGLNDELIAGKLITEYDENGEITSQETVSFIFARSYAEEGSDIAQTREANNLDINDYIILPKGDGSGEAMQFHPQNIYSAINGVIDAASTHDTSARLYLGDDYDSTGNAPGEDGSVGRNFHGGMGDDWIYGAGGRDEIYGEEGDDYLFGDYGSSSSEAAVGSNPGNDILYGGAGADHVYGGKGNDILYAGSNIYGLEGDVYWGGMYGVSTADDGIDTLDYSAVKFSLGAVIGCQSFENLVAEQTIIYQADSFFGFRPVDSLGENLGPADEVSSIERFILTGAKDWVTYTTDVDYTIETLDGGVGNDVINFSALTNNININLVDHNVSIVGSNSINELINFTEFVTGSGNDTFIDGEYAQKYDGGEELDTIDFSQSSRHVAINQSGGEALSLNLNSTTYDSDTFVDIERFVGTTGNDYLYVKEGAQNTFFNGGGNTDHVTADGETLTGYDVASFEYLVGDVYSSIDPGITLTLNDDGSGSGTDTMGGSIALESVEGIIGSSGTDTITGNSSANWLFGEGGIDTISAGGGNDHIIGGIGSDVLNGGAGDDIYYFTGENGTDTITDTSGTDTLYFMEGYDAAPGSFWQDVNNNLLKMSQTFEINGIDTIESVAYVDGASFKTEGLGLSFSQNLGSGISFTGDAYYDGDNDGQPDFPINDNKIGSIYDDYIDGNDGVDTLNGAGGHDKIYGGDGADTLYGGEGNDALYGGDTISNTDGGAVNTLDGGAGNDFLYGSGGGDHLYGGEGYDYLKGKDGDELHGDEGEDQLYGVANCTLDGGDGNDYLSGSGSNVTYIASSGTDVISDGGDSSTLLFEGGYLDDLTFERAANDSLVIKTTSGDCVIVSNYFSGNALKYISFGGPSIELSTLVDDVNFYTSVNTYDNPVYAAAMEQKFTGGDENNTFVSRGVDDIVEMGAGQNTVVLTEFENTSSVLLSTDVDSEQDIIKIPYANSFDDIELIYENGDMNLYAGNNKISIDGATLTGQSTHIIVEIGSGLVEQTTLADLDLTIVGGSGDLNGYSINDTIYANSNGSGLYGYTGDDVLFGKAGNDALYGGEGNDIIYDGDGNDVIYGGEGSDTLIDQGGDDKYYIDVSDYYANVSDTLRAGAGTNTVALDWDYQNDENGDIYTLSSLDVLIDGVKSFDDITLVRTYEEDGNGDPETINPIFTLHYAGNDLIIGGYEDLVGLPTITLTDTGEQKNVADLTIITDMSSYTVSGTGESAPQFAQNDIYHGTSENDYLMFSLGQDKVYGGDGDDNISKNYAIYYDAQGNVVMQAPSDADTFEVYGEDGNDTISGSPGSDYLDGGAGNDSILSGFALSGDIGFNTILGGSGDDEISLYSIDGNYIDGGEGSDTISAYYASNFGAITEGVVIDLNEGTITSDSVTTTFENIENAEGTEFDDHIIGDGGDNKLCGCEGNDILEGGLGNDTYVFWDGNDSARETGGYDVIEISYANYADMAPYLYVDIVGFDMVISIDGISYTIENQFSGQTGALVEGLKFDDMTLNLVNYTSWYTDANQGMPITEIGTEIAEPFIGTEGLVDTVDYSGSTAGITVDLSGTGLGGTAEGDAYFSIENIVGSVYDDILTGNDAVNELIAGIGNDILNGGAGDDVLSGGAGDDTYVFDIGGGLNTIMETSGFDIIELGLGLVFDDLTFVRDGNDLIIQIASGFIVTDFYSGDPNLIVEQISFSDGTTFDLTSLLNTSPEAIDDAFSGTEDTVITGNVRDNDTDADGDTLSVTPATSTTVNGGTVELLADGSFTYTPVANFNGTDSFEYTLEDEAGASDTGTVTLTVNAVNDAPVTQDDVFTIDEDTDIISNVLMNDSDVDGDTLSFAGVDSFLFTSSAHGEVILIEDGRVYYKPEDNYVGNDSFTYTVTDGTNTTTGTISMIVSAVNDAPEAVDDVFTGIEDTIITGNVMDNDTDVEGDAFAVAAATFTTPNGGIVELAADGSFTYTPQTGFSGEDSFTYIVEDTYGATDTGEVSLSITVPNSIVGTANDDTLDGTSNIDIMYGYEGNDRIYGHDGDDVLYGGIGNDILYGGDGTDTISGGDGMDYIYDTASTHIDGGDGTDRAYFTTETSGVTANLSTGELYNAQGDTGSITNVEWVYGSNYNDTFTLTGTSYGAMYGYDGDDVLYGSDGASGIYGGDGVDTIYGFGGTDYIHDTASSFIDGGDGNDTVYFFDETSGVTANLLTEELYNAQGDTGSITNVEYIYGSNYNDILTLANTDSGALHGRDGNDVLYGGDGANNNLHGGDGVDTIYGLGGSDDITDTASSFIDGGDGTDTVRFTSEASGVTANLLTGELYNAAGDVGSIASVERIYGSDFNDTFTLGNAASGTLFGHDGDDVLYGGDGSDWLYGEYGNDTLYGGDGVDMLYGQDGADTFVFDADALTANDNIQDFDLTEGDKLDISDILSGYDPLTDAITDFVQITENSGNSYLSVDADGGADNFVQIAYLYNATGLTDEEALETSGNLIAV